MTDYCTSCGRCKNCGAKTGAGPTMIFTAVPVGNNAAAPAYPVTIENFAVGGAAPMVAGCEHIVIR